MWDSVPVDPALHKLSGSGAAQDPVGKKGQSAPEMSISFTQNELLPPAPWDGPMCSTTAKQPAGLLKEGCCARDSVLVCTVDMDILWQPAGLALIRGRSCSWVKFKVSISATMADIDVPSHFMSLVLWCLFCGGGSFMHIHTCSQALQMSLPHPRVHPHTSIPHLPVCPLQRCVLSKMASSSLLSVYNSVFSNLRALLLQ